MSQTIDTGKDTDKDLQAVLDRAADGGRITPQEALDLARAADLWALVDLAARAGENPVADSATALLRAIAGSGDVHAVPG